MSATYCQLYVVPSVVGEEHRRGFGSDNINLLILCPHNILIELSLVFGGLVVWSLV